MTEQKKEWIRLAVRYTLLFTLAAALFLVMALTVFSLRNESTGVWTMPDVSGSYYTDVHNELSRMNLRIELQREYFPDRPEGIILTQSIMPGEIVHSRDKLVLTINAYRAILEMPDFRGTPLSAVLSSLKQITHEDQVYSLREGVVTFVYDESMPDGTVIEQFPPGGSRVLPGSTVDLLVSSKKEELKKVFENRTTLPVSELKNVRIDVVSGYFIKAGVDYQIVAVEPTRDASKSGEVTDIAFRNNRYELKVLYRKPSERFYEGFESISKEIGPVQNCEAALINPEDEEDRRLIWKSAGVVQELKLVFFRVGERRLEVSCGGEVVYRKKFTPEYPG
jgi:beta-lactam-binding protein with PASTA domain